MNIEREKAQYRKLGIADEDMAVHQVNGKPEITLTSRGTKALLRATANAGNQKAQAILDWADQQESFLLGKGMDPAQAAAEGLSDAMEAISGRPVVQAGPGVGRHGSRHG